MKMYRLFILFTIFCGEIKAQDIPDNEIDLMIGMEKQINQMDQLFRKNINPVSDKSILNNKIDSFNICKSNFESWFNAISKLNNDSAIYAWGNYEKLWMKQRLARMYIASQNYSKADSLIRLGSAIVNSSRLNITIFKVLNKEFKTDPVQELKYNIFLSLLNLKKKKEYASVLKLAHTAINQSYANTDISYWFKYWGYYFVLDTWNEKNNTDSSILSGCRWYFSDYVNLNFKDNILANGENDINDNSLINLIGKTFSDHHFPPAKILKYLDESFSSASGSLLSKKQALERHLLNNHLLSYSDFTIPYLKDLLSADELLNSHILSYTDSIAYLKEHLSKKELLRNHLISIDDLTVTEVRNLLHDATYAAETVMLILNSDKYNKNCPLLHEIWWTYYGAGRISRNKISRNETEKEISNKVMEQGKKTGCKTSKWLWGPPYSTDMDY